MTSQPDTIHIKSTGGGKPPQANWQKVITEFEQSGFTFADTYTIQEFPGSMMVGMISEDQSASVAIQLIPDQFLFVYELSIYYQDGTTLTVATIDDGYPAHPGLKLIHEHTNNINKLVKRLFREREDKPVITLTAESLPELGERGYRERMAFIKSGAVDHTANTINTDTLAERINRLSDEGMNNPDAMMELVSDMKGMNMEQLNDLLDKMDDGDDDDETDSDYTSIIVDDDDDSEVTSEPPTLQGLKSAMQELENWWQQHDPDLLNKLNPGCGLDELKVAKARLGEYSLPQDIVTLYQWHNGSEDEYLDIGNGRPFLKLEWALQERDTMIEALGEEVWNLAWLPIFGEGDEGLLVVLSSSPQSSSGLFFYNLQDDPFTLHYCSLQSMFKTLLEGFQKKILLPEREQDDEYYWVYHSDELENIRKKHNPAAYPFFKKQDRTYFYYNLDD